MNRMELFDTSRGLAICLAFLTPGTFISAPRATADSPDLHFHSHFVDDDDTGASSGNGDGVVNCDETIELLITLENTGDGDAHTVRAILSTNDPFVVEIIDSSEFYPDIPAGETATCIEDFDIVIAPDCPEGHQIAFDLSILADEGFWNDSFVIISGPCGGTPTLSYNSHVVDDDDAGASSGNGDGVVNCDETIELLITLENTGDGDAHTVGAILSTNDPFVVEIIDSSEFYPDIPAGETATCIEDFDIVIAPDCPEGHQIVFDLNILADEGFWNDSFVIVSGPCGGTPALSFHSHVVDDDDTGGSSGNGDGVVNCDETIELLITLQNMGDGDAHTVGAILSTNDPFVVEIIDSSEFYPDIPAGETATCIEDFDIVISPDCPEGHQITFDLSINAAEGFWPDGFFITAGPCSVCGNGVCDPGEDSVTCCEDCGSVCGDAACNCGEDSLTCCEDCGAVCGDGTCNCDEDTCTCPLDCGSSCGDGCCNGDEDTCNCCVDCGTACPDGCCSTECGEDEFNCPEDCCGPYTIGGFVYDDCESPGTSGMEGLAVCVDCEPGFQSCTDTSGSAGSWQIPDVPCGTCTVTAALNMYEFCHVVDACPPDPCEGTAVVIVDSTHEQENLNIEFLGVALPPPECDEDSDCDDADPCSLNRCVNEQCVYPAAPAGTACGDQTNNDCTDPDTCDGTGNCLQHDAPAGTLCGAPTDDACTDPDSCDGTGNCLPNNEPDGTDCGDGLYCNGAETCGGGVCQAGTALDCNDGIDCTDDACNEATDSCDHIPNDAHCPNDGQFCNGTESCNASSGCVSSGDPCPTGMSCNETTDSCEQCQGDSDCDDGVDCTDDTCVATTCVYTPNDADCPDDGLFCNGTESCDASSGCISSGDPCPAGKVCNEQTDTCEDADLVDQSAVEDSDGDGVPDAVDACPNTAAGAQVDTNGCACDQLDQDGDDVDDCSDRCPDTLSSERVNEQGCSCSQINCDDDDSCTIDSCLNGNCINAPIDCDDGDSCTEDNCSEGLCQNTPIECPDDTQCIEGECIRFWTLTVRLQPEDAGRPPPAQWLQDGTLYTLPIPESAAESLYVFDHWEGSIQPAQETADILEILMDSDKILTAVYRAVDCLSDDDCGPDMYCLEEACVDCRNDDDCADDGLFCNGAERCAEGACIHEGSPCPPAESCDENLDTCCVPAPCGAGCGCTPDAPMVGIILFGLLTLRFVGRRAL